MINRILIRIKVIQILYSYLLVEKRFSIEKMPLEPSKEKRFAYSLYLDMLVLLYRISEKITQRGEYKPLRATRFIQRILSDENLSSRIRSYNATGFPYEKEIESIAHEIKNSSWYKNTLKGIENNTPGIEENLWSQLYRIFVLPSIELNQSISKQEGYTSKGLERMQEILAQTFSNFMASHDDCKAADSTLRRSLDDARELYFRLLLLPVELTYMERRRLEENQRKYLPTDQDLNPNTRFIDNEFVSKLQSAEIFKSYIDKHNLSWYPQEQVMMDSLLKVILESDIYREYMAMRDSDLKTDCDFWKEIYKKIIFTNTDFLQVLEDTSVFWNDDLEIMGTFVLKTIKRVEDGDSQPILAQYKDEEDSRFGYELLHEVLKNREEYRGYIDSTLSEQKWTRDRLAFMDVIIIITALAEILNFPKIPLHVSINEYVEIAKSYSSSKSGAFVHGLLASIIDNLKRDGKLLKIK